MDQLSKPVSRAALLIDIFGTRSGPEFADIRLTPSRLAEETKVNEIDFWYTESQYERVFNMTEGNYDFLKWIVCPFSCHVARIAPLFNLEGLEAALKLVLRFQFLLL